MTTPVGALLVQSWNYFTAHVRQVVIGAVIFGALLLGAETMFETQVTGTLENTVGDLDRIEELSERIEGGDEEAFQEMLNQLGVMGSEGQLDEGAMENMALGMIKSTLPAFSMFFIVMGILTLIMSTYYTVLAIEGKSAKVTFGRIPGLLLPMLGVWVWTFLRSFAWIPVVGFIIAIIIGPRLALSSVILVKEGSGVFESVKKSYAATRGYWGKIVGNMIVMTFVLVLVTIALVYVTSHFHFLGWIIVALLGAILQQAGTAYASIFHVQLSETILKNKKKA